MNVNPQSQDPAQNSDSQANTEYSPKSTEQHYSPETLRTENIRGYVSFEEKQPQEPEKKQSSSKRWLYRLVAVLAVVSMAFGAGQLYSNHSEKKQLEEQQQAEKLQQEKKAQAIQEADSPFSVLVGEVKEPAKTPLKVEVKKGKLTVGKTVLTIPDGKLTATVNKCELQQATDLCLAARGEYKDMKFEVFAFKDIANTRFLDNPTGFTEIPTVETVAAASMTVDMGGDSGKLPVSALARTGENTGFAYVFPADTTAEKIAETVKASNIEAANIEQ